MNYAVPPVVLGFCFNAFYTGIGKTKIITIATFLMALTNIILDYIFIFGKLGLPAMGIKGAALATATADYVLFFSYLVYFIYKKMPAFYKAFRFTTVQLKEWWSIVRLSSPIVLQNLIGLTSWQYFFICVEKLGEHELAVSGILKSLFVFLGIPVWSLASASNTVVSNIIGQNRIDQVIPALKKVLVVTIGISLSLNLIIALFPHTILGLFTNDPRLLEDTIPPFYTLMIALLFFSSGMIMNQGIIGTGATMVPAIVELLCSFAYVAYAYYFIYILRSPLYIAWGCEVVYWLLLLLFTVSYWGSGTWKKYIQKVDTSVE
jgi:putative MATE family efflux protein